ncbi:hypothetical protein ACH5RR_038998 [Cinchona calisaya]|uniref:Uncharacterized protein n=1 Tax=Cinchona calisaya TaxID=153742 RepID=A0ABD2Y115_9GENT
MTGTQLVGQGAVSLCFLAVQINMNLPPRKGRDRYLQGRGGPQGRGVNSPPLGQIRRIGYVHIPIFGEYPLLTRNISQSSTYRDILNSQPSLSNQLSLSNSNKTVLGHIPSSFSSREELFKPNGK